MHIAEALVPKLSSPYEVRLGRDIIHGLSTKTVSRASQFITNQDAHTLNPTKLSRMGIAAPYQESIIRDV